MNQWQTLNVVERDAGKVSGAWLFRGTRVPVTALFDNLRDGATTDELLTWLPGGARSKGGAVLEHELGTLMAA